MREHVVTTKAELIIHIEQAWTAFNARLAQFTEEQMTKPKDTAGWSAKDHIAHLTAWERSVIFFLQGKPRHLGLGIDEETYLEGTYNDMNATIFEENKDLSLFEVLTQFRATHYQLMKILQSLINSDLQQPYSHYLPDEAGDGGNRPAINIVYGNTADHYREHLPWIEAIIAQSSSPQAD